MKQIVKYSILPGFIVAVANALCLWILGAIKVIGQGNSMNDPGLDFVVYLFLLYILVIVFSAILSRKIPFSHSFVFALLSVLAGEFVSAIILGITNQSAISVLNFEVLFGPVLMKENYVLLAKPVLVISVVLLVVALVKIVFKSVESFKNRQSVGRKSEEK